MGFRSEGFDVISLEMNADALESIKLNHPQAKTFHEVISAKTDWKRFQGIDIIIGGPPCQPYSRRGKQFAGNDPRDGIPSFIDAIRIIHPRFFVMENVPELKSSPRHQEIVSELQNLGYSVFSYILNAVEFGVPQKRKRVFLLGSRTSFKKLEFSPFVKKPVTTGLALGPSMNEIPDDARFLTKEMEDYVARYERLSKCRNPRDLKPDEPSRTVTCRNLASATSDMLRILLPDGRRRMLSIREGAILQGFPEDYRFYGKPSSISQQIGNAVPPLMSKAVAMAIVS